MKRMNKGNGTKKATFLGTYNGRRVHRWDVLAVADGDLETDRVVLFADTVASDDFGTIAQTLAETVFLAMVADGDIRPFHIDSTGPKNGPKTRTFGWSGGAMPGGLEMLAADVGTKPGPYLKASGGTLEVRGRYTLQNVFTF